MAIPVAVVPVAPFGNAAELIAIAHGELARVLEVADTSVIAATELLLAREALLTIADFMALAAAPAIVDTSEITIAARLLLYALLPLPLVTVGLEVGEAALAATTPVDTLCLALLAAALDALRLTFTTTAALHALSLTAATTFHLSSSAFTTATATFDALRLLAAATASALGLLAAAAALGFLPAASAALGLGVTAMSSALVGLCRCRRGNRKCRNAGCENELPHLESPLGSEQERSCYGAVPLVMTLWERSTPPG
jgi:hypothetical protein